MGTYGDTFNSAVAAELRAERGRRQVTIDSLAATTGFAKTTVLNYLNGKRDIPTPAFVELCRALGVSPRLIFERADNAVEQN